MELTDDNIRMYLKLCASDIAMAIDMWETLEMRAADLVNFMQQEMGIPLLDRNPGIIDEFNEADLEGAL